MLSIRKVMLYLLVILPLFTLSAQTGKLHYSIVNGDYDLRRVNFDGTNDEQVYLPPLTESVDAITIDSDNNKLYYAGLLQPDISFINQNLMVPAEQYS